MSPQDALKLFEQLRQQANLSGKDHDAIREAVIVLRNVIEEKKQKK